MRAYRVRSSARERSAGAAADGLPSPHPLPRARPTRTSQPRRQPLTPASSGGMAAAIHHQNVTDDEIKASTRSDDSRSARGAARARRNDRRSKTCRDFSRSRSPGRLTAARPGSLKTAVRAGERPKRQRSPGAERNTQPATTSSPEICRSRGGRWRRIRSNGLDAERSLGSRSRLDASRASRIEPGGPNAPIACSARTALRSNR